MFPYCDTRNCAFSNYCTGHCDTNCYYRDYLDRKIIGAEIQQVIKENKHGETYIALVGHSYGAATAMRIAQEHPDKIKLLILIDPVGSGSGNWYNNYRLESLISQPLLIKKTFVALCDTSNFYRSNIIALLGSAWRNNKKVVSYLNTYFSKLKRINEKKLEHNSFNEMMLQGGISSSYEAILIKEIREFHQSA